MLDVYALPGGTPGRAAVDNVPGGVYGREQRVQRHGGILPAAAALPGGYRGVVSGGASGEARFFLLRYSSLLWGREHL